MGPPPGTIAGRDRIGDRRGPPASPSGVKYLPRQEATPLSSGGARVQPPPGISRVSIWFRSATRWHDSCSLPWWESWRSTTQDDRRTPCCATRSYSSWSGSWLLRPIHQGLHQDPDRRRGGSGLAGRQHRPPQGSFQDARARSGRQEGRHCAGRPLVGGSSVPDSRGRGRGLVAPAQADIRRDDRPGSHHAYYKEGHRFARLSGLLRERYSYTKEKAVEELERFYEKYVEGSELAKR
jgi:hypothetical protein